MAWASVGRAGSTGNATNNNSSVVVTLNGQAGTGSSVGDILILCVGVNNFSSVSNADEGAVTSVTDSGSNVWVKAREITNGNAASTVGTVCSMWYSRTHTALTTSNTVTANFSNSAARDGCTAFVSRFTAPGAVTVADSTYLTNATSLLGTIDQTETATEFLRFRAVAARTTLTAMTTTSGWTTMGTTRSSATVNQAIFGEWIISSASTKSSAPSLAAAVANASVYAVFEETPIMAQVVL